MLKILDKFIPKGSKSLLLYGKAGTGKTCSCLVETVKKAKEGKTVIFLDTENSFPIDRVKQIAGTDYKNVLKKILLFSITSFKDQQEKLKNLDLILKQAEIGLVVVDTINSYYRRLVKGHQELANNMLKSQMKILHDIGEDTNVMITSQVYEDITKNKIEPIGKFTMRNYNALWLKLEDKPRRFIMEYPEKKSCKFKIVEEGMEI